MSLSGPILILFMFFYRNSKSEEYRPRASATIISEKDLETFDEIVDSQDGWASAKQEIDYNAKLQFSDEEDEDPTKPTTPKKSSGTEEKERSDRERNRDKDRDRDRHDKEARKEQELKPVIPPSRRIDEKERFNRNEPTGNRWRNEPPYRDAEQVRTTK